MSISSHGEQHLSQREHEIIEELRLTGGSSRIPFLAGRLNVSEETIRRNIKTLQESGHVTKVHGGVHLKTTRDEQPLHFRMNENAEAKRMIAATLAAMIENGDRVFLDIGSTTAFIAAALQKHRDLFVVTNSILVAHSLAARNGNRVFFAGGELRAHDGGTFGGEAHQFLRRFSLRHAIFSVAAIRAHSGFMLHDMQEAELSRQAGRQAEKRIIVADSSKFGRSAPIIVEEPIFYDMLVTDALPPADIIQMLDHNDIKLVVAERNPARL